MFEFALGFGIGRPEAAELLFDLGGCPGLELGRALWPRELGF
jgi:hypothetical protein